MNKPLGALPAFLFIVLLSGCTLVNVSLFPPKGPPREQVVEGEGKKKILLLEISGFISSGRKRGLMDAESEAMPSRIRENLQKAASDPDIAGIILKVNSPGGTVTASDIVYHEIVSFRKKRNIPVYAVILSVGTSGAYYIASATDRIYAHPSAATGSIGVIAVQLNFEGLMEKIGVEDKVVKSGKRKDIFSPFRPDTQDEREIMQTMIDELHSRFLDVVERGRGGKLTRSRIEELADGRPYTAGQALEAGLIDSVGYLDTAIDEMKETLGLSKAKIITYRRSGGHVGSIYSLGPDRPSSFLGLPGVDAGSIPGLSGVAFLYLWRSQQ